MRTGVLTFLVLSLTPSIAAAACERTDCCIEKECCSAWKNCDYGCMCSFSCSSDPRVESRCSCSCVGGPKSIVLPVTEFAISLSTQSGIKTTVEVTLQDLRMLLTKTTNWEIRVDSDVENTVVPVHEWEGPFAQMIAAFAADIGVQHSFDDTNKVLTFSSLH